MSGDEAVDGIWRGAKPLVLASTSRTRRDLLASTGITVEPMAPDVDERAVEMETEFAPDVLALRLADAKAESVARHRPDRIVVGADQVLALDGEVFHKPANAQAARAHLTRLQGRRHALHSGVAIMREGAVERFGQVAYLTMRPLDEAAIAAYVALAGEAVTSSVGAYRLEGLGIHLFERIEGDQSTILGLPLLPLLARLRRMGLLAF